MLDFIDFKVFSFTLIIFLIYIYFKYNVYNYWKRHGIPCDVTTVPFGSIPFSYFTGKITFGNMFRETCNKFQQYPFHGFYVFYKPILIINDPKIIKLVLIKEFSKFPYRGLLMNEKIDKLISNLFHLPEKKWKRLRTKLSPAFTPKKLKELYPLILEISDELINTCDIMLEKTDVFELKDIVIRYTIDIISSIVFGFNCNSLKNPNTDFKCKGEKAFIYSKLSMIVAIFLPEILESISVSMNHNDVQEFLINLFQNNVDYRRREKIIRKDFMNLLMQLIDVGDIEDDEQQYIKNKDSQADRLSMGEAICQAYIFFIAGFETSASTATYCLLELAVNPDIQEKLHQEIDEIANSPTGLTYESIMGMEYLDMVFSETLRKYPPLSILNRICTENFPIPNSSFTIPKGMRILISPPGIHHNPKFFPEPDIFDPSRFTKENIAKRPTSVHLGFGEGPRNCIGKLLGTLQTKQAIATMLKHYKFFTCDKTEYPVKFSTNSFMQIPKDGIHLRVEKRNLNSLFYS